MSVKPDLPAHPDSGLNKRSSSSDKQSAIERYYKFLSSDHSVDSTSNTVIPNPSKSEDGNAVTVEFPRLQIDETATDITPEIALPGMHPKEAGRPRRPSVLLSHEGESRRTEELQAAEKTALNELSSDNQEQLLHESLPGSEFDAVKPVGTYSYVDRKEATSSNNQKRLRFDKFPRVRKRIAFGALYTVIAASIAIVGFSIMDGRRSAEPPPTHLQSGISSRTEAPKIPASRTGGPEIEDQKSQKQVPNADSSHASKPSKPAEPGLAVPGTLQSGAVGVHETDLTAQREVAPSQSSNAGQVNTTQQSTDQAAAPRDPVHELTLPATQSPSASQRSAETPPHTDMGQLLGAIPKSDPKATATAPTRNLSAEPPSRARAAKRRRARTPRQDDGSRPNIHR